MKTIITITILIIMFCGCGNDDAPKQAGKSEPDKGRKETQKVLAADAVGYDGQSIRNNLDNMLDTKDKQAKDLEKAQGKDDERQTDQ